MLLLRPRFSLCGFYFGSKLLRVTLCGANGTGLLPPTNKEQAAVFSAAFPFRCRIPIYGFMGHDKAART